MSLAYYIRSVVKMEKEKIEKTALLKEKWNERKEIEKLLGKANYRSLKYSNYKITIKYDQIILVNEVIGFSAIKTMQEAGYDFIYASKKWDTFDEIKSIFKKKVVKNGKRRISKGCGKRD